MLRPRMTGAFAPIHGLGLCARQKPVLNRFSRITAIAVLMPLTCLGLSTVLPAPALLAAPSSNAVTRTCANNAPGSGPVTLTQASFVLCWSSGALPDQHEPVAESSPIVATLGTGTPSVVVGDRAGYLYAYQLSNGTPVTGWPVRAGAPVDATPSVVPVSGSSGPDDVFVGTGDAAHPYPGGYEAYEPDGTPLWSAQAPNPPSDGHANSGVQASLTVTDIGGSTAVFAGSLGQESYALSAAAGKALTDWPFLSADTNFSTAASADLYGNGQDELVMGGSSTAGVAEGQSYSNGGHLRVLNAQGALIYGYDTNQEIVSSPAVGNFLAGQTAGIVVGTGARFAGATDTDTIKAFTARLGLAWSDPLDGYTSSSPALADIGPKGQLDVVEGTDTGTTGSVWVLDGATGKTVWDKTAVGRIIGSVVTADLSGNGYQDVLVPTLQGVEVLDGTGSQIAVLGQHVGFQNSPLVTEDPNGTVGITIAGYYGVKNPPGKGVQSQGVGIIQHYEIWGSNAALPAGVSAVGPGSWPMFHHDPSLSGVASALPDSGTATPTALIAQAGDTQVSLSWTAPTGTGASSTTGYNVYEAASPGHESGAPINGATLSGTHFTVTGLTDWQTYYFEVTAINAAGEGAPSNEASATPSAPAPPPPPPPPPPRHDNDNNAGSNHHHHRASDLDDHDGPDHDDDNQPDGGQDAPRKARCHCPYKESGALRGQGCAGAELQRGPVQRLNQTLVPPHAGR